MIRQLIILLVFLLSAVSASGQLVVRIGDEGTNEPIPGAVIEFRGTSGELLGKQFTNAKGVTVYKSPLEGGSIKIRALGYRDTIVTVKATEIYVQMKELPLEKSEIVVTAQRHATAAQDVPISISTVESKEILSRAPREVDEVLRYIPGVTVTEDQVSIRGSSG